MRPVRALGLYLAVVFLGGALLAPWLYWLAGTAAQEFPKLAHAPFHRFVNRSMLALALAGLWPLLRALGAGSWRHLGLIRPAGRWRQWFGGFLLGFLSLATVAGIAVAAGGRNLIPHPDAGPIFMKMLAAALTAVTVAVMEEILFRGGIFGGLRRVLDWRFALTLSSMIYAMVHFFARTQDPQTVTWTSGFHQLGLMLGGFADWQQIIPGFFSLTLAGLLLGLAYQRTGDLYFSIGLHAGWIFWVKSYAILTARAASAHPWFWGTEKMTDSWLALAVLTLTLAVFTRLPAGRSRRPIA